jgi:type II secretory pathway component PulM
VALKGKLSQLKFENLYNQFLGLQPREQTMALGGAGVVLLLIVVVPIWLASGNLDKLQRTLNQGQQSMDEIVRAIDDYNKKNAELTALETKLKSGYDANANVTLENLAKQANIKYVINSRPNEAAKDLYNETSVKVQLKEVTLKQLTDFLYQVEYGTGRVMRVDRMRLKPTYSNRQVLDADFDVTSFRLQEREKEGEKP